MLDYTVSHRMSAVSLNDSHSVVFAWTERNLFATSARRLAAVPLPSSEEGPSWETPISRPARGDDILRSVEKAAEHYAQVQVDDRRVREMLPPDRYPHD
jgi:hypothetical protein